MTGTVLRLELRRSRSITLWLGIVVLVYGGFIAGFYPVIRDNTKLLTDYMAVFPKPLLAAFGLEGSLSDPGVFFNTYLGSMLWPIVAAIAAAILGTRTVAADLERGFIELPLSTRLNRGMYLAVAILGQVVVLFALSCLTVAVVPIVGAAVGAGFDAGRFLMAVPVLFVFACAVAAVATLLSVATLRRGASAGIVAGLLLVMYLMDAVSKFSPDFSWLASLSAFHYLRSTSAIDEGVVPLDNLALFTIVALASWLVAVWAFRRRDLVA